MTEFETASLALQTAGLDMQALSAWSTLAYAVVSLIVGSAQCWLIWQGLKAMRRASDSRDKALDAQMVALKELIARTGGPANA